MKANLMFAAAVVAAFILFEVGLGKDDICYGDYTEEYPSNGCTVSGTGGSYVIRIGEPGFHKTIFKGYRIKIKTDVTEPTIISINPYIINSTTMFSAPPLFLGTKNITASPDEWDYVKFGSQRVLTREDYYFGIDFCASKNPHLYKYNTTDSAKGRLFTGKGGKGLTTFNDDFVEETDNVGISLCPDYEQSNCGNGQKDDGEECEEGEPFCNINTCKCLDGSTLYDGMCTGCGNGRRDPGELCDGESWCNKECDGCTSKYIKFGSSCFSKSKFIIIVVCSLIALVIIITAPITVCVL